MQECVTWVREIKYLTQHVAEVTVELTVPDILQFKAGQFMQFAIGQDFRSYSIISVPDYNKQLKFCVELVPGGVGSNFVKHLQPGQEVRMRGPSGVFTFDSFHRNAFFVATGVGIAPLASMIPDILSRGYPHHAQLLFGLRDEESVFYFDRFRHLASVYQNFTFTPTLSRPQLHWPGEVGRVTTWLDIAYEKYRDYLFYICGSSESVNDVRTLLLNKGHSLDDIRFEVFT